MNTIGNNYFIGKLFIGKFFIGKISYILTQASQLYFSLLNKLIFTWET